MCGNFLAYPVVLWSGTGHTIYFHEGCSRKFLLAFGRDVWELERARSHGNINDRGELTGG
jgi:hypothetical protein